MAQGPWTVTVQEDKTNGELVLPFPSGLGAQMGWRPGDTLRWIDNGDGTVSLQRKRRIAPPERRARLQRLIVRLTRR